MKNVASLLILVIKLTSIHGPNQAISKLYLFLSLQPTVFPHLTSSHFQIAPQDCFFTTL
jgi:hypothetical protein